MGQEDSVECGDYDVCFKSNHQYCDEAIGACASCGQLCNPSRLRSSPELMHECQQKCSRYLKDPGTVTMQSNPTTPSKAIQNIPTEKSPGNTPQTKKYFANIFTTWKPYQSSAKQISRIRTFATGPEHLRRFPSPTPISAARTSFKDGASSEASIEELLRRQTHLEYLAMATLGVLVLVILAGLGRACYRRKWRRHRKGCKDTNLRNLQPQHLYEMMPVVPNNYTPRPVPRHESTAESPTGSSQASIITTEANSNPSLGCSSREPSQDTDFTGLSNINCLRVNDTATGGHAGETRTPLLAQHRDNGEYAGMLGRLSDSKSNSTHSSPIIHQMNQNVLWNSIQTHSSEDTGISCDDGASRETTMLKQTVDPTANEINEYKVSVV